MAMREQTGWLIFFGAATIAIGLWLKGVNIILALTVGFIGSFVAVIFAILVVFRGDIPE